MRQQLKYSKFAVFALALGLPVTLPAGFMNWDVTQPSVDLVGNGFWDMQPGHGLYVDLEGTTWSPGIMVSKQVFAFDPGATFTLSFELAGNWRLGDADAAVVQVGLGSIFRKQYVLGPTVPFTTFTETISVPQDQWGKLLFAGVAIGYGNTGLLLDDIRLFRNGVLIFQDTFDTENNGVGIYNYGSPSEGYPPGLPLPPNLNNNHQPPPASTPDAGSTVMLFSMAMATLAGIYRNLKG